MPELGDSLVRSVSELCSRIIEGSEVKSKAEVAHQGMLLRFPGPSQSSQGLAVSERSVDVRAANRFTKVGPRDEPSGHASLWEKQIFAGPEMEISEVIQTVKKQMALSLEHFGFATPQFIEFEAASIAAADFESLASELAAVTYETQIVVTTRNKRLEKCFKGLPRSVSSKT